MERFTDVYINLADFICYDGERDGATLFKTIAVEHGLPCLANIIEPPQTRS